MAENDFTVNFDQDTFTVVFGEQGPQGPAAAAVPFDIAEVFEIGNIVYDTTGDLFGSRIDNNVGNPLTDTDSWVALGIASGVVTQLDDLTDVTLSSPTDTQVMSYNASTQQWMNTDATGGQTLTAGNGINIDADDEISVDPSEIIADGDNPGTIPALPTDLGSSVFTENLKSDNQFHDDGSQFNLSDNINVARAPNGGSGNQYVAHTAGDGIGYTLDADDHLITSVIDDGITTAKIADGNVTAAKLGSIPIDTLSDVDTTTETPVNSDVLAWDQSNTRWRPFALPLRSLSDVPNVVNASQILRRTSDNTAFEWVDETGSSLTEGFGIDITSDVINWDASPNEVRAAGAYSMVSQWTENTGIANGQFAFLTAPDGFDYQVEFNKNDGDGDVVLDDASVAIILGSTISLRSATGNGFYYIEEQGEAIASYTFNLRFLSGNDILLGEPADLIVALFSSDETLLATETTPGFIPPLEGDVSTFLNSAGTFSTPTMGDTLTFSDGLTRTVDAVSLTDSGINEVKLNATNDVTAGQILSGNADGTFTWVDDTAGSTSLNDLTDVHAPSPVDGYVIRYVDSNTRWEEHSLNDTMRLYGGVDMDLTTDFIIPSATGTEAIAIGYNASASEAASIAIGRDSIASHENSTAIGENATAGGNNEVRLGGENSHVTIDVNLPGTEANDNQLASVKYVKDAVSDASRIVTDSVNGIYFGVREELPDPWGSYEIDPFLPDAVTRQVATSVQFYDYSNENTNTFYAGTFQRVSTSGDQQGGSDLTNNTIPAFFEEQVNVQTDNNIGAVGGEDSTCLGWKYVGYQDAKVWMANPVEIQTQLRWTNHDPNNPSVSVPQVGMRMEWARVKPEAFGDSTIYDLSDSDYATAISATANQYYDHGQPVPAGQTLAHDLNFTLPQGSFANALTISDDDVIVFRYTIFFHGNEFSSDPANNIGLSLDIYWENLGSVMPMFGIETVDVSDQLVMESTGDLRYTDNVSGNDLLLIDNVDGVPEIPAAALGLTEGNGIDITGKSISAQISGTDSGLTLNSSGLAVTGGAAIDVTTAGVNVVLNSNSGLSLNGGDGLSLDANISDLADTDINDSILSNNQILTWNVDSFEGDAWRAVSFDIDILGDTTISNPQDGQVLTYESSDQTWRNQSVSSGTTTLAALTDTTIATPTDGQVITYNTASSTWENTSLSGNHSFTAGTGLSFNTDGTVLNYDGGLGDASDVTIASVDEFQVISYNTVSNAWENMLYNIIPYSSISVSSIDSRPSFLPTATRTTLVGPNTVSTASNATAVGYSAQANGASGSAYGDNAIASNTNTVAVGHDAAASGVSAIAIGDDSTAVGIRAVAIGDSSTANASNTISIGNGSRSEGLSSVSIGLESDTNTNALGIAIGERATVEAVRGIAIGASDNSADENANLTTASGQASIAIGSAASATATNSAAIGQGASATIENSTVLGDGSAHRLFIGNREIMPSTEISRGASDITCSTNNEFFTGGFNPTGSSNELLNYTEIGNLAMGRFEFTLATTAQSTNFNESDRWTLNSTSIAMRDAFGFSVGSSAIALGNFVIAGSAYNSAAMGDFWLHPDSSLTNIIMSFRVRSVIGTAPSHDSVVSAQFTFAKF